MRAFSGVGDAIARRWRERSHDEAAFPAIAASSLMESELLRTVRGDDVVDWAVRAETLPAQNYTGFGQPPVVLYRGHEFYIEALFWFDSTTAIHQHAFSGAFAVLDGSSVHAQYDFEQHERVSSRMLLGDVRFRECEVLSRGDVRPIDSGNRFIHALFHLDRPSVSIVVRTGSEPAANPQYTYHRPGVAIDPFYEPEPMMTQLRLLDAARQMGGVDGFVRAARSLLGHGDFWLAYRVLSAAFRALEQDGFEDLAQLAIARFGARVAYLRPVFEEQRRQQNITARREQIHDADHRYLLALLLNVPTREGIDRLIAARHPGDPGEHIVRWIRAMSEQKQIGLDFDPLSLLVLEYALAEATLDDVRSSLRRVFPQEQVEAQESKLRQLWDEIVHALLLQPLFARSA
jgi:hypothetical protein